MVDYMLDFFVLRMLAGRLVNLVAREEADDKMLKATEQERERILGYMSDQAPGETVQLAQKVYSEQLHAVKHDIWDVPYETSLVLSGAWGRVPIVLPRGREPWSKDKYDPIRRMPRQNLTDSLFVGGCEAGRCPANGRACRSCKQAVV